MRDYERVASTIKRFRAAFERVEGGRDILHAPDWQWNDLKAERARCRVNLLAFPSRHRNSRHWPSRPAVAEPGTTSRRSSRRLPARSLAWIDRPVTLPPGRASEATKPAADRVSRRREDDRDESMSPASPRALLRFRAATMTSTLSRTNSAAILGIALGASLRPAVLDRDGAALDPAEFAQPLHKRLDPCALRSWRRRRRDTRWSAAFAAGCARAASGQRRRAAKQRDELAPSHSITSSARASSVGGTSRPSALAVLRLITSSYLVGA